MSKKKKFSFTWHPIILSLLIEILLYFASRGWGIDNLDAFKKYFWIVIVILLPEAIMRTANGHVLKNGSEVLYVILERRDIALDNLVNDLSNNIEITNDDRNKMLRLAENSLSMLGIMIAVVFSLVMLPVSIDVIDSLSKDVPLSELGIFVASGFFTFILLILNLALCYSLLVPDVNDLVLVKATKKYYLLQIYALSLLGITLIYGISMFADISPFVSSALLVSVFFILLWLYYSVFAYRVPVEKDINGES